MFDAILEIGHALSGRVTKMFNTEYRNINSAALILAVFTFVAQLFGLIRDRMLAGRIGPGAELDIYVTAFQIPDLMFALGASLVSVTILIPFLSERLFRDDDSTGDAQTFLNSIFSSFMIFMVIGSAILWLLMPILVPLVAPGFDMALLDQVVRVSRVMLLSPILLGVSNLLGSVTQLYRKFFVYALSPILYNIGAIIGIVFLYKPFGVLGLAYGVVIGAMMHMLIQLPVVLKYHFAPKFQPRQIDWATVWNVIKISAPRTLTLAFAQITITILIAYATRIGEGAASIFRFAMTLNSFPVVIVGISYSVAAFPSLVEAYTKGEHRKFLDTLFRPARKIIFWSIPVIVLFVVLRAQIVRVVLGTGEFGWADTRLTAAVLAILVVSVVVRGLMNLLVRGYYAAGKTWHPFMVNALSTVLTLIFAFVGLAAFDSIPAFSSTLERLLRVSDIGNTRLLVLGLAYSLGTFINFFVLYAMFRRAFKISERLGLHTTVWQSLLASLILGEVAYIMLGLLDTVYNLNRFWGVFLHGFVSGIVGIAAAAIVLYVIGNQDIRDVYRVIRRRIF